MIHARPVRELVTEAAGERRAVSAASGLVRAGGFLYVIADDEHELAVFDADRDIPGRLVRFREGALPEDAAGRKRAKPDLEALALLPPNGAHEHGALLALGSGSRPQRRSGVLCGLDAGGAIAGEATPVDLTQLYVALDAHIPDLNLEGAAAVGDRLLLFQRGNGRAGVNAVVELSLAHALRDLTLGGLTVAGLASIRRHELGEVGGARLCFTDGASLLGDRVVFTAVAEAGEDTYADGACVGAAVGVLDAHGELAWLEPLEPLVKVEGVTPWRGELLLVADADDRDSPSPLLAAPLPG